MSVEQFQLVLCSTEVLLTNKTHNNLHLVGESSLFSVNVIDEAFGFDANQLAQGQHCGETQSM